MRVGWPPKATAYDVLVYAFCKVYGRVDALLLGKPLDKLGLGRLERMAIAAQNNFLGRWLAQASMRLAVWLGPGQRIVLALVLAQINRIVGAAGRGPPQ